MKVSSRERNDRVGQWLAAGALVLLALAAYLPALAGDFLWDDDQYVVHNTTLRDGEGLVRIWTEPRTLPQFYPLVFTSFWVEYQLCGLAPAGYHLVNVLLHGVNGILLWRLVRRLELPQPWLIAAVFVLHPVHVESVAWISERKNVLSGCFYLASALAYGRFAQSGSRGWYALAFVLFVGALLGKTVTATLPAAVLLLLWRQRGRLSVRDVAALVPFFLVGIGFGLLTAWLEKTRVGAEGPDWSFTLVERCLIAGRALWFYAAKLAWPAELSFIYPRWQIDATQLSPWLYLLTAAAVPIIAWCGRRRWGRGPLVACLYFGGTLFPALGFFDVYPMRFSFVADHFVYLASIGLLTLGVASVAAGVRRLPTRRLGIAMAPAALLVLGMLTFSQAFVYHDLETLWSDTLAKNPDAWIAHHQLGMLLYDRDDLGAARKHFREAVRLKPTEASAEFNLGRTELALGNVAEAIDHLRVAVQRKPDFGPAHDRLAQALLAAGKPAEAVVEFEAAVQAEPNDAGIAYNFALALTQLGRREEAQVQARRALQLRPHDARMRELFDRLVEDARRSR